MSHMSELDIDVQERVRMAVATNQRRAAALAELAYADDRPSAVFLAREAAFWGRLLDVIDYDGVPTASEAMVLAHVRTPIEQRVLVRAHQAAKKAAEAAARTRPGMELVA